VNYDFSQQVLRTDAAGMPLDWVSYQEATRCYHLGQVLYSCGNLLYKVHGGINAISGKQSVLEIKLPTHRHLPIKPCSRVMI